MLSNVTEEDLEMNFYDHSQTLFEDRQCGASRKAYRNKGLSVFDWRSDWLFFRKSLAIAMTVIALSSAEVFSQPIKLGYAALSAGQVTAWMAKEGGYLSKYGIEAELIYIPAIAATQ